MLASVHLDSIFFPETIEVVCYTNKEAENVIIHLYCNETEVDNPVSWIIFWTPSLIGHESVDWDLRE